MNRACLFAALGVLLLTIVDGAYLAFLSHLSQDRTGNEPTSTGPVAMVIAGMLQSGKQFIEQNGPLLTTISGIAVAWFTFTLWRATSGMFRVAEQQATDMRASLAIAKQGADAATKSADAAERTVKTMEDTAVRQLRAYVSLKGLTISPIPLLGTPGTPDITAWHFEPKWQNNGVTVAKSTSSHTSIAHPLAESDFVALNFEDQFFPGTGPTNATSTIGPSITITGQTIDIPISLYDKLKAEGRGVYIWGWMEYDDVYAPSTPRRRTEFCVYLGWEGNPKVRGAGEPKAYFYRSFNGSDSDCYRQPAV